MSTVCSSRCRCVSAWAARSRSWAEWFRVLRCGLRILVASGSIACAVNRGGCGVATLSETWSSPRLFFASASGVPFSIHLCITSTKTDSLRSSVN